MGRTELVPGHGGIRYDGRDESTPEAKRHLRGAGIETPRTADGAAAHSVLKDCLAAFSGRGRSAQGMAMTDELEQARLILVKAAREAKQLAEESSKAKKAQWDLETKSLLANDRFRSLQEEFLKLAMQEKK